MDVVEAEMGRQAKTSEAVHWRQLTEALLEMRRAYECLEQRVSELEHQTHETKIVAPAGAVPDTWGIHS